MPRNKKAMLPHGLDNTINFTLAVVWYGLNHLSRSLPT